MHNRKSFNYLTVSLIVLSILFFSCNQLKKTNSDSWTSLAPLPLDPVIEAKIDEILPKLTL